MVKMEITPTGSGVARRFQRFKTDVPISYTASAKRLASGATKKEEVGAVFDSLTEAGRNLLIILSFFKKWFSAVYITDSNGFSLEIIESNEIDYVASFRQQDERSMILAAKKLV
jgi:hypothetical protein